MSVANPQAFDGDTFLHRWMETLVQRHGINVVVETGTETGATAIAFSHMVPTVYTCDVCSKYLLPLPENVHFSHLSSPELIRRLAPRLLGKRPLFYLDAHVAPVHCELMNELAFIADVADESPVVVIHDFLVPGRGDLGYDHYNEFGALCLDVIRQPLDAVYPRGWEIEYNREAAGAKRGVAVFCSTACL